MKLLIATLVLSVLGLASAAIQYNHGIPHSIYPMKFFDAFQAVDEGNVESLDEDSEIQELSAVAAQLDPLVAKLLTQLAKVGIDVLGPLLTQLGKAGIKVGSRLVKQIVNCGVCGKCVANEESTELLSGGEHAKLMAIVEVMESINAAEQKLNGLNLKLMKDNRIAEAEFIDWVSGAIKKAISKLRDAVKFVKNTAKKVLCEK